MAESLARAFVDWLGIIPNRHWLVVGGSAELVAAVLAAAQPSAVMLVATADRAAQPLDPRVRFRPASVENLPFEAGSFDLAVGVGAMSPAAIAEMRRVLWPAGIVAVLSECTPAELETWFQAAGLHAIQTAVLGDSYAVRGTR